MKRIIIPINVQKKGDILTLEDMQEIIDKHLEKEKDKNDIEIIILTKPNYINKKVLNLFKKNKVKIIELEINSTNDYILQKSGEKYNFKDIKKISKKIKWKGFKLGFQMMIGLPESTRIDEMNTAKSIIKMKPKIVSLVSVLVIKGTKLEKQYNKKKYKPLTLVQAVEACKELVEMFNTTKIETIEIGYGETMEPKELKKIVVSGPYHQSFKELVESALWYDAIVNKIKQLNVKVMEVEVTANPIDVNNVIGYKKENIEKLKDLYDVDLIVTPNENIDPGKSKIEVAKIYQDFKEK